MSDTIYNPQQLGESINQLKGYVDKKLDRRIGETEATLKEETQKAAVDIQNRCDALQKQLDESKKSHADLEQQYLDLATKFNRNGNAYTDSAAVEKQVKLAEEFNLIKLARYGVLDGPQMGSKTASVDEYVEYTKAFNTYCRKGKENLEDHVRKLMSVGSDPDGGFWILPPTISNTITTRIFESTPMRELATVVTIGSESYEIPQDPNDLDVMMVSETGSRDETGTPTVTSKRITAYEIHAQPKVTLKFLEDANVNVEQWLGNKLGDKYGRYEGYLFTMGDGAEKPHGFMKYPAGTQWGQIEQVPSGQSGQFTYAGLMKLMVSLKEPFHRNAKWLTLRTSLVPIMTLTDADGRLIFQPITSGLFNGTPLLGYELRYAADMPAVGAGALAMAFGDFKAGYVIVDRVGMSTRRDDITQKGFVKFWTRKRVGGDVDNFDAIKIHVLS